MPSPLPPTTTASSRRHPGPPLGWLGVIYTGLFLAGFYPGFWRGPVFPPAECAVECHYRVLSEQIVGGVAGAPLSSFGAAVPLGIFSATIASRFRFQGIRAAGPNISFFGGLATVSNMMVSSGLLWTMSHADTAQDPSLIQALYRFGSALGGVGFSAPFGLLIMGIAITAGFGRLLRPWPIAVGVVIAVAGEPYSGCSPGGFASGLDTGGSWSSMFARRIRSEYVA
jgi:hypothetical protein